MQKLLTTGIALTLTALIGCGTSASLRTGVLDHSAQASSLGQNQLVVELASFESESPSGIAVSSEGRVFVTFPWLDQQPTAAVAELTPQGDTVPYPNAAWNHWDAKPGPSALRAIVSGQALTITHEIGREYLWVLDSGNPRERGVVIAGPKLFKIDIADDTVAQVFYFDHQRDFAADSILSDVRVDPLRHTAYISDARRGGVYVVDLKQRETRAVLVRDASTRPELVAAESETSQINSAEPDDATRSGVAGLELSADGRYLYYHALSGRTLYRVPTAALRDAQLGPKDLAKRVEELGTTGSAMDGLAFSHDDSDLYMTAIEQNAVFVRRATGKIETLLADERLRWPDSLALAGDGYLYLTASARHHEQHSTKPISAAAPYYVLKASVDYLERAAVAAKEAEEARTAAAESQFLAAQAQQRVADAHRVAQNQADGAEAALQQVALAAQAVTQSQFVLAEAQEHAADRFIDQSHAAAQAQADAQEAKWQAQASSLAASDAQEAARIAALRAAEAQEALALTEARFAVADQSEAQARLNALAHEQALQSAAIAWAQAQETQQVASQMQGAAEAYQARAQVAVDAWKAEASYAQEYLDAAQRAQRLAETAARSYEDAQLAEVRGAPPTGAETYELADVPTDGQ